MDHLLLVDMVDHRHRISRNGGIIQDLIAAARLIGINNSNNNNILVPISLMVLLVPPHPMDLTSTILLIIVDLHRRRILNMAPLHRIVERHLPHRLVAKLPFKLVCLQ